MNRILKFFRQSLLTGIVILVPLVVTAYLFVNAFLWFDTILPSVLGIQTVPGIGLAAVILIIFLTGVVARNYFGRSLITLMTALMGTIPVLRNVYGLIQQIADLVFKPQTQFFRQVVMIEYPRRGIWALGFVTSHDTEELSAAAQRKLVSVFLPTSPNPTSGFTLYVPVEDVVVTGISPQIAVKAIVSMGMVSSAKNDRNSQTRSLGDLLGRLGSMFHARKRHLDDPRD